MYYFDFHLSRLSKLNAASAQLYRDLGKVLPDQHRPKAEEGLVCMSTKVDMKALKDADFREIIERWRAFSFLRDLYTDSDLFEEYESFRECASKFPRLSLDFGIPLMEPAAASGGIKTSNTKHHRFLNAGFKASFHKSIVLHSMAVECLRFARRAIDLPVDPKKPETDADSDARKFESVVMKLWNKQGIDYWGESNGQFVEFLVKTKIECLEVFDFLYAFLLPKILPFEILASWIGSDAGVYHYAEDILSPWLLGIGEWQDFLDLSRWVLQPRDLVELIEKRAWTGDYPADRSMYMQTRGMFEQGVGETDFRWLGGGDSIVEKMRDSIGFVLKGAGDRRWWDDLRFHCGSIFLAENLYKYREGLEKLREREGREFGDGPMAAAQASRAALPFFYG